MKNETFARAMTQLDDDLILEAHAGTHRRRYLRTGFALAACFVLLLTVTLWQALWHRTPSVYLAGQPVTHTAQPVSDSLGNRPDTHVIQRGTAVATFSLDIRTEKEALVSVSSGSLLTVSSDGKEQNVGTTFQGIPDSDLYWAVSATQEESHFTLTVTTEGETCTVSLDYNDDTHQWTARAKD